MHEVVKVVKDIKKNIIIFIQIKKLGFNLLDIFY